MLRVTHDLDPSLLLLDNASGHSAAVAVSTSSRHDQDHPTHDGSTQNYGTEEQRTSDVLYRT